MKRFTERYIERRERTTEVQREETQVVIDIIPLWQRERLVSQSSIEEGEQDEVAMACSPSNIGGVYGGPSSHPNGADGMHHQQQNFYPPPQPKKITVSSDLFLPILEVCGKFDIGKPSKIMSDNKVKKLFKKGDGQNYIVITGSNFSGHQSVQSHIINANCPGEVVNAKSKTAIKYSGATPGFKMHFCNLKQHSLLVQMKPVGCAKTVYFKCMQISYHESVAESCQIRIFDKCFANTKSMDIVVGEEKEVVPTPQGNAGSPYAGGAGWGPGGGPQSGYYGGQPPAQHQQHQQQHQQHGSVYGGGGYLQPPPHQHQHQHPSGYSREGSSSNLYPQLDKSPPAHGMEDEPVHPVLAEGMANSSASYRNISSSNLHPPASPNTSSYSNYSAPLPAAPSSVQNPLQHASAPDIADLDHLPPDGGYTDDTLSSNSMYEHHSAAGPTGAASNRFQPVGGGVVVDHTPVGTCYNILKAFYPHIFLCIACLALFEVIYLSAIIYV